MTDKIINIAFSPCPNDTFIFHAMLHEHVDTGDLDFKAVLDDIEALNQKALLKTFHITKLSFFAYLKLKKYYEILDSGAALGFGCGPMLICKYPDIDLTKAKIAIPGKLTTANLLLTLWKPEIKNKIITRFDNILSGVQSGKFDAGLIIHESRFVYKDFGLKKLLISGTGGSRKPVTPSPLDVLP